MNRELYTANGCEWFEPSENELTETLYECRTMALPKKCILCDEWQSPQMLKVKFQRTRQWVHTGGISGKFTDWSVWKIVGFECLTHYDNNQPF